MQKGVDKEILNYVDMKILAQVNRTRNPSENKIREAKYEDPDSDLLYCTFPTYEASKLLGVDKHICMITVLGDPGVVFFNNGFSDGNEKKALWSGQKRKNPIYPIYPSYPILLVVLHRLSWRDPLKKMQQ